MELSVLKCKIHRATVTETQVDYEGSCAIDENLLDASGIREYEQIHIWNVNNGERLVTYAIRGERGSGMISLNGSAAHRAKPGDLVIIAAFALMDEAACAEHQPRLVYVDADNRVVRLGHAVTAQAA
ncbi:MAG: aspartate 1-decarboxylase [Magnetococcales bacterium]|nr:aspartate 1-decarboxylase [Magnetococcales bacterium]